MKVIKLDKRYRGSATFNYKVTLPKNDSRIPAMNRAFEQMYGKLGEWQADEKSFMGQKYVRNENWTFVKRMREKNVEFFFQNTLDFTAILLMI